MQHVAALQLRAIQGLHDWHIALNEKLLTFEEAASRREGGSEHGIEALPAL